MATAEQLRALLESHVSGDNERFLALFLQLAAQASRQGQSKFAAELTRLVDKAQAQQSHEPRPGQPPIPIAQPRGELGGLVSASFPKTLLSDLVLSSEVSEHLGRILLEQKERQKL